MEITKTKKIRIVHYYKEYLETESLIQKLVDEKFEVSTYYFFTKSIRKDKIYSKKRMIFEQSICLLKLLLNLHKCKNTAIFCFGGHYSFFVITKLFGFLLGKNYHLYCYNFYLHDLSKNRFVHFLLKLFLKSRKTTMIVQSPNEVKFYEKFSSNPVHFIPFSCSMDNLPDETITKSDNYLFSGGYSNRDYQLLFKCIRQNPQINFVIVASALNKDITDIPHNAKVYKDLENKQFNQLLMNSAGVIIPLKSNVGASGQLVSLLAMQTFKPVIYCNISVINYYFVPNETGIPYEMGNAESLNNAIQTLASPEFNKEKMAEAAFIRCSENFTKKNRDLEFIKIVNTHIKTKSKKMRFYYSLLLKQ